jgi:hypothetical protein
VRTGMSNHGPFGNMSIQNRPWHVMGDKHIHSTTLPAWSSSPGKIVNVVLLPVRS